MNESNNDLSNPLLNLTDRTPAGVSPLEQEVLDEYTRLLNNMNHVRYLLFHFLFCLSHCCLSPFGGHSLLYAFVSTMEMVRSGPRTEHHVS